jgi:hypothetical protein
MLKDMCFCKKKIGTGIRAKFKDKNWGEEQDQN